MNKLSILALAWSSSAAAARHPRVDVAIDPCLSASDEIVRVVQIELGDLFAAEVSSAHTHATAECAGAFISLHVDDPISGRSLSRSLELSTVMPASRPRLVALALVELVASSWTELGPAVTPPSMVGAREGLDAPPLAPAYVRIAVEDGAIRFSDLHVLQGYGLRLSDGWRSRLGWTIDGHKSHGQQAVDKGVVKTEVIDIGVALQTHAAWSIARFDAGAGLRGGTVQMQGMTIYNEVQPSALSARWFGIFAGGHAGLPLTERVTLDATVEAGYVLQPVGGLVEGQRSVAVDGAWVAGHLGIGVTL